MGVHILQIILWSKMQYSVHRHSLPWNPLPTTELPEFKDVKTTMHLFTLILLNYGVMCWGNNYHTNLNKICTKQNKCIRREPSFPYYQILKIF